MYCCQDKDQTVSPEGIHRLRTSIHLRSESRVRQRAKIPREDLPSGRHGNRAHIVVPNSMTVANAAVAITSDRSQRTKKLALKQDLDSVEGGERGAGSECQLGTFNQRRKSMIDFLEPIFRR